MEKGIEPDSSFCIKNKRKKGIIMKWENEYGEIIAYEHKQFSITTSQLCEGLCSKENLRKIKEGGRVCDKILADALLQRLGVSMDKFSYLVRIEEWDEIRIREEIVFLVDNDQKEKARQALKRYKTQLKGKHILFMQFYELASTILDWKNGERMEKIQQRLQKAWNFTKKGKAFQIEQGECYSFFELALTMLKIRLLEEEIREDGAEYGIEQYQNLLTYLENQIFEQDRVKWYPQVAYRQIKLLRKKGKLEQAIEIAEKSLSLLKDQASLNYLLELLEEYRELLRIRFLLKEEIISKEMEKQLADMDLICENLRWLYQKYKVNSVKWIWYISFGLSEIYLCQDVIRGRRIGMGMTQEELAEGICDPVTISRIERGESFPQQKILTALLQKLKWSGNNYTLTAQVGEPRYHAITSRISMLTHTERLEEAEELLKELEIKVKERTIFAEQYFLSSESLIKYGLEKMDAKTCLKQYKEALYLTMPKKMTEEQLKQWHFSRTEVMCINDISYLCKEIGKEEELIEFLFVIKQFYERQPFPLRYYRAGYELTMRNIGNLLGNIGNDKEAIEAGEACIQLALGLQKAGNLSLALYDKGWDMERLWEEQFYTKEESFAYSKASYALNLFLGKKKQYEHVKTHIKKVYKEDI